MSLNVLSSAMDCIVVSLVDLTTCFVKTFSGMPVSEPLIILESFWRHSGPIYSHPSCSGSLRVVSAPSRKSDPALVFTWGRNESWVADAYSLDGDGDGAENGE